MAGPLAYVGSLAVSHSPAVLKTVPGIRWSTLVFRHQFNEWQAMGIRDDVKRIRA